MHAFCRRQLLSVEHRAASLCASGTVLCRHRKTAPGFLLVLFALTFSAAQALAEHDKAEVQTTTSDTSEEPSEKGEIVQNQSEPPDSAPQESHAGPVVAIRAGKIHTMSEKGVITAGVLLIQEGKILDVGDANLAIPDGAEIIDAPDLELTPGWIDADSQLWLTTASSSTSGSDASLKIVDGIDAFSEDWHEVVRHGVTSVYLQPSERGTLGGFGAVVSVVPKVDSSIEILSDQVALQASLGISASNNRTRAQQYERTKKALDDAKAYQKKWNEYREYIEKKEQKEKKEQQKDGKEGKGKDKTGKSKQENSGKESEKSPPARVSRSRTGPPASRSSANAEVTPDGKGDGKAKASSQEESSEEKSDKPPKKPEEDPVKEALVQVLDGKLPIRMEIHSADDAFYALKLMKDFPDIQFMFEGLSDLGSATSDLMETGSPVVLGPWLSSDSNYVSDPDSVQHWAEKLLDYPGSVVVATRSAVGRGSRLLRFHLARAIALGMLPERALRSVTIDAARLLSVDGTLGSLEPGKRADIVAFQGVPLDSASPIQSVWVRGIRVVHRDLSRFEKQQRPESVETSFPQTLPAEYVLRTNRCLQANGELAPSQIHVKEGKIVAVSTGAMEPSELPVIELGDAVLTPGLFSSASKLGLADQIDPAEQPDSSYVVAADAMPYELPGEAELLASGFLKAALTPGDANPLAGSISLIRLGAETPVATRVAAAKLVLDASARSATRFPSSLAGQLQFIEQSFAGKLIDTRLYVPEAVSRRLEKERLARVQAIKKREQPVLIQARSDAELRGALDLIERLNLKATIYGAEQLAPFLDQLAALDVTVVASPVSLTTYQWYLEDLAAADAKRISVVFAGDDAQELRLLASQAVEQGMNPESALSALFHGSAGFIHSPGIKEGQPADFVVWSASPLDLGSQPLAVVVDGRLISSEDTP